MANVIKHKRGSGSDPAANNLVLGELAIRTDTGKLFTKMDSGAIAEIAGGGSDIAINTLSSSSATGGGSATFNGSAYRFTLSAPPSVSAQQLLVSINGVIQKPVAGTGQPSEGFSVDGTDIILGDAPATGSDFFILTFKSLGVSEPADNSVTSAKIVDGAIVNADINASAAIAGTKIDPDFGSQNITTSGDLFVTGTGTSATFKSNDNNYIVQLQGNNATNKVFIGTTSSNDFLLANGSGVTERLRIDSSGNVGIGTSSPGYPLDVRASSGDANMRLKTDGTGSGDDTVFRLQVAGTTQDNFIYFGDADDSNAGQINYNHNGNFLRFFTNAGERMRIDSSGRLLLGTTTEGHNNSDDLTIANTGHAGISVRSGTSNNGSIFFSDGTSGADEYRGWVQYTHTSDYLTFGTNAGERLRIDTSGRLLLGTTTEGHASADDLTIAGSGQTGITIRSGTSNDAAIFFADGTSGDAEYRGFVQYNHTNDQLNFGTAGSTRATIKSDGKVGIGTTSPDAILEVTNGGTEPRLVRIHNSSSNGSAIQFTNTDTGNSTNQGYFVGLGASGDANVWHQSNFNLLFATNNTERMRIDSSGNVGIGMTPAAPLHVTGATADTLRLTNGGGTSVYYKIGRNHLDGKLEFRGTQSGDECYSFGGVSGEKIRFQPAGGISFNGDTAAANALDDYEEGTFTPEYNAGSSASACFAGGISLTRQVGHYTKVGAMVLCFSMGNNFAFKFIWFD